MSGNMYDNSLYVLLVGHGLLLHGGKTNPKIADDLKSGKKQLNEIQKNNLETFVKPLIEKVVQKNDIKDILAAPEFTGSENQKKELLLKIIEYARTLDSPDPKLDEIETTLKDYEPLPETEELPETEQEKKEREEKEKREQEEKEKREQEEKEKREQRKRWKERKETGENDESESDDEAKIPQGKIVVVDGFKQKLYSSKNKDATEHWPYRMAADTTGTCILYEKRTRRKKENKAVRFFGVQFEKGGCYQRELWTESKLSKESPTSLEEWDAGGGGTAKMDQIDPDTGIVTETQPGDNDRLAFQTSERKYPRASYGSITKVLFVLMRDYGSTVKTTKKPMIDYCVLFSKTKFPKIVRPSDLDSFTSPQTTSEILDALIKRDQLGSLEEHAPLRRITFNPKSRFFNPSLHGAYAIRIKPDHTKEEQEHTMKEED